MCVTKVAAFIKTSNLSDTTLIACFGVCHFLCVSFLSTRTGKECRGRGLKTIGVMAIINGDVSVHANKSQLLPLNEPRLNVFSICFWLRRRRRWTRNDGEEVGDRCVGFTAQNFCLFSLFFSCVHQQLCHNLRRLGVRRLSNVTLM